MVSRERAAKIDFMFAEGHALTTSQVADLVGLTYDGARKLLQVVTRVIPIYQDDSGLWRRLDKAC